MGTENEKMRTEDVPGQSARHDLFSRSPSLSPKYCRKQKGHTWGVEEEGGEVNSVYAYRCMCVYLVDVEEREGFIFSLHIIFSASASRLQIKNNNTLLRSRWQIKRSNEYNQINTSQTHLKHQNTK